MDRYKLWLKNAIEQANVDDSWYLNARQKARNKSIFSATALLGFIAFMVFLMFYQGLLN